MITRHLFDRALGDLRNEVAIHAFGSALHSSEPNDIDIAFLCKSHLHKEIRLRLKHVEYNGYIYIEEQLPYRSMPPKPPKKVGSEVSLPLHILLVDPSTADGRDFIRQNENHIPPWRPLA